MVGYPERPTSCIGWLYFENDGQEIEEKISENSNENEFNRGTSAKRRKLGPSGNYVPLTSKGLPPKISRRKVGGKRKTRKAKKSRKH